MDIGSNIKFYLDVPVELKPKLGMWFNNEKDAYDFYNAYARSVGFSIRNISSQKKKKEGECIFDSSHAANMSWRQ